jgi:hypothetical protein
MITTVFVVIVVAALLYFAYTKISALDPNSTAAKQNILDTIPVGADATLTPAAASLLADSIYNNFNSWWVTTSGYSQDIENEIMQCQNDSDFALLVKQFGSRASTISPLPYLSVPVTASMTLPEWCDYKLQPADPTGYANLQLKFQNTGLLG